jgi:hypothetical protein
MTNLLTADQIRLTPITAEGFKVILVIGVHRSLSAVAVYLNPL